MGATATTANHGVVLALCRNGVDLDAGAKPRIRLDSLQLIQIVGKLFTGNMTVVRQYAGRPAHWIVREKLTIRSERPFESASYDIAQNLSKMSKG
jgi:hypothetical protein